MTSSIIKNHINQKVYLHTQSTPSSAWNVQHNLDEQYVNVTAVSNDQLIIPESISFTDENNLTITLESSASSAGYAIITGSLGKEDNEIISEETSTVISKNDGYTIVVPTDNMITFTCSSSDLEFFYLPEISLADAGFEVTIVKTGTGPLSIASSGSTLINGQLGNFNTTEMYSSSVTLELVHPLNWVIKKAHNEWYSGMNRVVNFCSYTSANVNNMDYVTITTLGNAIDFGDTIYVGYMSGAVSSTTRGVKGGGYTSATIVSMDYLTISILGNTTAFGSLTAARSHFGASGNIIRGIWWSGYNGVNVIDYATISTLGNNTDFGDNTLNGSHGNNSAMSSMTRAINAGGITNNVISYVTIMTTGNGQDFGDLTSTTYYAAGFSNTTRGITAGGTRAGGNNIIDYITIATLGNATDFGDLATTTRTQIWGASSCVRGITCGATAVANIIEYITIMTTGNASDFGDLTIACNNGYACSDSHGGLFY